METRPASKLPLRVRLSDWIRRWSWPKQGPIFAREHARHQETYDVEYYEFIESSSVWSREVMADSIVRDLAPRDVLDIGCGTGALLDAIQARAVHVYGLEYSDTAIEHCRRRGLPVHKFDIGRNCFPESLRQRDVAISFEVAEHLSPELANRFVELLSAASDTVVMSAATPGQGGTSHLNEQPHEYWIKKMARRGYTMDTELSMRWRAEWKGKTASWYHSNVMLFRRPTKQSRAA
jgi:cyclopropane fatty-acyl-phospholipid synthase-like methyltransferase